VSRFRRSEGDGGAPAKPAENATRAGPSTVFDYRPPDDRVSQIRRVPALTWLALRLVWAADRRHLSATVLLQVVAAAAIAAQLLVTRRLLDALVELGNGGSVSALYPWLGALALITALLGVIAALTNYEQKLLVELASRHAFDRIIEVSVAVDFESFENAEFYDQLQRARNSGLFRLIDMVNSVTALTTGVLTSIGIAVVLFVLEPVLLVFVAVAAIFPLLATILNSRAAYVFEHGLTADGRERQYLMELLTEREPAKEIRIFGAGPFLHRRYNALTDDRVRQLRTFLYGRLKVALLGSAGGLLGTVVALGALIVLLDSGRMTAATALTAALAMQQLGSRLTGITTSAGRLIESSMFIHDFRAFLELASQAESAAPTANGGRVPAPGVAALEVQGVSFRYPGSDALVLDDVSLSIAPGEVVALVGENGSGKTTLVKLICQLYRPDQGLIRWNGTDTRELPPDAVRDQMTVLFQDYVQYHLSVRDNILLGRPDRAGDDDAVRRAAAASGADRFLSSLPDGYDTRLGREFYGGYELSIGQWQRLALARAFFRGGSFLVLDEPTASLDPRAEADLFAQMRELARGRSVLLVSHRFSSVRPADRIYVLEAGRVVEHGDHDALMANDALYAELFTLQAEAYLGSRDRATADRAL
jgi:ATP-binding cassette, subfamily B, bacterial